MESNQFKLQPCGNCGFNVYELIDGGYYCTECSEKLLNVIAVEYDEFGNTGTQKSQLKVKGKSESKKQKAREENQLRRTSYEEYNYILHGLTNEILELEDIPNFKVTVLQLWVTYLKSVEAGFVEEETLALPKFFAHYRQSDAEILYNKRPKEKKTYKKKKNDCIQKADTDGDTIPSIRSRKRKIRKGLAVLDTTETSFSSSMSMSSLASMSIDDITSMREAQELNIEYSNIAKDIRKKVVKLKEKYGRDVKINDEGDVIINYKDLLKINRIALLLNEKTLIYILYSALNICKSRIQLGDLMRLTREGLISFYNFRAHIPENHRERLSLTKGHTFAFNKTFTIRSHFVKFAEIIPDLKSSFKLPDIKLLVKRYLKELSLPDELHDYIDRLINFLPPVMKFYLFLPNYEARAVAYIIFTLKVIFGIDGYREIEISRSAKKMNKKLSKIGIESHLFIYEEWREFIAYRNVILSKYYYPFVLSPQYQGNKPYASFLAMLEHVNPEHLSTKFKAAQNVLDQKRDEKIFNSKKLASKLLSLHTESNEMDDEEVPLKFSFTPLHDAMTAIINSNIGCKLNTKIIDIDHCTRSCELFLKPSIALEHLSFKMKIKKCKFPNTYFFKKVDSRSINVRKFRVVHDGFDVKEWKNDLKKSDKETRNEKKKFTFQHHSRRIKTVLANRLKHRKNLFEKKMQKYLMCDEEMPQEYNILDGFLSDDGTKPSKVSESDEINDLKLDELTASLSIPLHKSCRYNYEMDHRNFTFITPDFNLWHRFIGITDINQENFDKQLAELPKNFRWLLAAAANVINQDESEIYRQLMIIEMEFIKHQKPVELNDVQPSSNTKQW